MVIRYGVATSTAQRAHRRLIEQGLARGEKGSGVFVTERAADARDR
jgi:DNA-binding transcriptional regulator YhcF (GntR family)